MSSLSGLHLRDKAKSGVSGLKSKGGSSGSSGSGGGLRDKAVSSSTTPSKELSLMVKDRMDGQRFKQRRLVF
jgi:hypothetical protein